jgi:hypothetical protein
MTPIQVQMVSMVWGEGRFIRSPLVGGDAPEVGVLPVEDREDGDADPHQDHADPLTGHGSSS